MDRVILAITMAILSSGSFSSATVAECGKEESSTDISVSLIRNTTGEWHSSFLAEKRIGETTDSIHLNLKHTMVKCGSDRIVRIEGIMDDVFAVSHANVTVPKKIENVSICIIAEMPKREDGKLRFHYENKGNNIIIINDGRTAYRNNYENQWGNATLLTNRPLKDEELFEVAVDETIPKWDGFTAAIGVTVSPPIDTESIVESYHSKNEGIWVLHSQTVYHDRKIVNRSYNISMDSLKAGDRVGVRVRSNGDLHFLLNGKDMGLAASKIPTPVYGMADVIGYIKQMSLVG